MYMKYTANTLNRYENSMDFSDEEIEFIMNTSPLLSKQLAIPIYEKERLLDKFSNTKSSVVLLGPQSLQKRHSEI